MIHYKKQCIFEAVDAGQIDVLIHQCNCFNNMGAGIAPLIAKRFPEAHHADLQTIRGDLNKLGSFSYATTEQELIVINAYGQYHYSRHKERTGTEYPALRKALQGVSEFLRNIDSTCKLKIGMPKIGCGLGGGSWDIVSNIINEELSDFDVTVYII